MSTIVVGQHDDLRIVHISIQRTHLHLLVEAKSGAALTSGVSSFLISAARRINRTLGAKGRVFDRYHARRLSTPREVRNCLAYVLNNWRHHREDRARDTARWLIDKYSSAIAFDGWKELRAGHRFSPPLDCVTLIVWQPKTWLLSRGWLRYGLVRVREVPGARDDPD